MAGRKKTETVEAEVVETAVVPAGKMEFRLINPTEDGFLRRIQWNKEELEAAVRAKIPRSPVTRMWFTPRKILKQRRMTGQS